MINNKGHVLSFTDDPIHENSALTSTVYNSIIDSLKASTLRCINRTRDLSTKVTKLNMALAAENYQLNSKYNELITNKFGTDGLISQTALVTGYDTLVESHSVVTNNLTGQMTINPVNKWSKVVRYLGSDGRNRASKDISIAFGDKGNPIPQTADSDIYSMLDGYSDTFWLASVKQGNSYTIRIQFPTSIKPYVDYLTIIPFPAFGFTVNDIFITKVDGTVISLIDPISSNMGIIDVNFAPVSWGGILTMNITATGDVIGIADLDIGLSDYEDSVASMVFTVPALTKVQFNTITFLDLSDFDLFGYSLTNDPGYIKTDHITATVYQGTTWPLTAPVLPGIPIMSSTFNDPRVAGSGAGPTMLSAIWNGGKQAGMNFYIKFTMTKYLGQTPTFRSAKITYGS